MYHDDLVCHFIKFNTIVTVCIVIYTKDIILVFHFMLLCFVAIVTLDHLLPSSYALVLYVVLF